MNNNAKHETWNIKDKMSKQSMWGFRFHSWGVIVAACAQKMCLRFFFKNYSHGGRLGPVLCIAEVRRHQPPVVKSWASSFPWSACSGLPLSLRLRERRPLASTVWGAYLWHTGSTSPRWRARWGGRSSWCCSGCCRSWCDGWGRRCLPPRNCLPCDRPLDSGYNASDDLDRKQRRGTKDW